MPYLFKAENVNYINKSQILINNIESDYSCEKLLENKLEIYLVCKDWKVKGNDIVDIYRNEKIIKKIEHPACLSLFNLKERLIDYENSYVKKNCKLDN